MAVKGIDVSSWQGNIDFKKVKASGVEFVIIRSGYGNLSSQKDNYFDRILVMLLMRQKLVLP